MTLHYASTFAASLNRLTAQKQKQVKVTTVDLMLDPTSSGLQMHRVAKAPGFWTARVSQDIRLVLHKADEDTVLPYVDHHDAAYRWAERKRLVAHERTGAMQLVEIVERSVERLVYTEWVGASSRQWRLRGFEPSSRADGSHARRARANAVSSGDR